MPAGFQFLGRDVGLWVPAAFSPRDLASGANYLTIVARLEPAVSPARAQANLETLSARLAGELPDGRARVSTEGQDAARADCRETRAVR